MNNIGGLQMSQDELSLFEIVGLGRFSPPSKNLRNESTVSLFSHLFTDPNLDLPVLSAKLNLIQLKSGYKC